MELQITKKKIEFDKEINELDRLVLDFVKILDKAKVRYVLVSGYIAILFGRSRGSEDIDIIIEKIDPTKFEMLWHVLAERFECVNAATPKSAYGTYLNTGHSIRFSRKGMFVPNVEVKLPKYELDYWTLDNRKQVVLNGKDAIFISPIELQIPFKLSLGSEKDIGDARYLYDIFKDRLDNKLFMEFLKKLDKEAEFEKLLKK